MDTTNDGKPQMPDDSFYSFEEFRMVYDSTELISERKIAFNRNNASLCLAVIAGQGVATSWCYQKPGLEVLGPIAILTISKQFLRNCLKVLFCLLLTPNCLADGRN